jgi:hypothetical protein
VIERAKVKKADASSILVLTLDAVSRIGIPRKSILGVSTDNASTMKRACLRRCDPLFTMLVAMC